MEIGWQDDGQISPGYKRKKVMERRRENQDERLRSDCWTSVPILHLHSLRGVWGCRKEVRKRRLKGKVF